MRKGKDVKIKYEYYGYLPFAARLKAKYWRFIPTLVYFGLPFFIGLLNLIVALIMAIKFLFVGYIVWAFVAGVLSFVFTIRFARPLFAVRGVLKYEKNLSNGGRVRLSDGPPETGKTLTQTYNAHFMARKCWAELLIEYYLIKARRKRGDMETVYDEILNKSILETVDYYVGHPEQIPLLVANYAIKDGDRFCSRLEFAHFLQEKRLPERGVISDDECADDLSNRRSQSRDPVIQLQNEILSDTFSKERHYGEWYMFFAEQNSGEPFNGLRRVVGINRELQSCDKVCLPQFLLRLYNRHSLKILLKGFCTQRRLRRLEKLGSKISRIGFFEIRYRDYGNNEKGIRDLGKGKYYIPINLEFRYSSRGYMPYYKCLNDPLEMKPFNSLSNAP
ncbi:hypothetical protein FACS1894211_02470 [Clostridia bacterium]|nr:hypothetical protein FACS1894211_02470 [Clostridia bacterium]